MRPITHIVIHTAGTPNEAIDQSAETIRNYHVNKKGWSDIGYHAVIRFNGTVEPGRPQAKPGAGVKGFNATTYHICVTGNGDFADFTPKQKLALKVFVRNKLVEFGIADEFLKNPMRVCGHKEATFFPGVPPTDKTCPGRLVSMRKVRQSILALLLDSDPDFDEQED